MSAASVSVLEARFEDLKQGADVLTLVVLAALVTDAFIEMSLFVDVEVRMDLVARLRRLHRALRDRILMLGDDALN